MGVQVIRNNLKDIKIDPDKTEKIIQSTLIKHSSKEDLFLLGKTVSLCKSFIFDVPSKIDQLMDDFDIVPVDFEREEFIKQTIRILRLCKEQKESVDFDDMIWFNNIFNFAKPKFDYVFIDEQQDLTTGQINFALSCCKVDGRIIGLGDDRQCVDENTIIQTPDGNTIIKNISIGDRVLSYSNGSFVYEKVLNKVKSSDNYGIKITTKSGKSLIMSPRHKIWAEQQQVDGKFLVYLMYRSDLGFRVGKTNKWKDKVNPFGARAITECADKLWILEVVASNEEAIYLEEYYSLKFGIPTAVFEAEKRQLSQERIDKIFSEFGLNGLKLLEFKQLSFDYPHWLQRNTSTRKHNRYTVNIVGHNSKKKYSTVSFECSDDNIVKLLKDNNFPIQEYKSKNKKSYNNYRLRKCGKNYADMYKYAVNIADLLGAFINERLSFNGNNKFKLITASALFEGMNVLSIINNNLVEDEIISITKINGVFYDIEVENTNNFLGNGILSHNSIYEWRGAEANAMENLQKRLSATELRLPISYRCPRKIVELAQEIVPDIQSAPNAIDGEIFDISDEDMLQQVKPGDFILSRVNAPLIKYCMLLLKQRIPANIAGRDIGNSLVFLLKKSKKKTLPSFLEWLEDWKLSEVKRLRDKNRSAQIIVDKYECLINLSQDAKSLSDLEENINKCIRKKL